MSKTDPTDKQIEAFLESNPAWLAGRPALLALLELKHETDAGTSLIEHQVSVLRDQVAGLREKLQRYHESAEANEALLRRVHELYLAMIGAGSVGELVELLVTRLKRDFDCDEVAVGRVTPAGSSAGVADFSSARPAFQEILDAGAPVCGRLSGRRLEEIFEAEAVAGIRSAAVVPFGVPPHGLLVMGSKDEGKFYPGMGTLFLELLGEMFGQRLEALDDVPAAD